MWNESLRVKPPSHRGLTDPLVSCLIMCLRFSNFDFQLFASLCASVCISKELSAVDLRDFFEMGLPVSFQ